MTGGEAHTFRVPITEGQYLRVVVEQQGIDVAVRVLRPDDQLLIEKDSPNGLRGQESVSVVAQSSGDYIIEVSSDKTMPRGGYEIKVQELQEPTPENMSRVSAEQAFAEGQRLRSQGSAESRRRAVEKYQEALALWSKVEDVHEEAYTLCNIGRTYKALGDLPEAVNYLNQASALLREARDDSGQAFMLNELGAAYRDLGDPLKALEPYNQALALRRNSADAWGEAQTLNNIGLIYARTGSQRKALDYYKQSLSLWQTAGDHYREANTLNNIAGSLDELGESSQALNDFQQVLKFAQDFGDQYLEAYAHNNIGKIYDTWADAQNALDQYKKSAALFHNLKNSQGEALALDNTGMVYVGLGDTQKALEFLNKSLLIREQLKEPWGRANTLTGIGYAYAVQGSHQEALRYYELALPLSQASKDRKLMAYALDSAGMAYTSLGDPRKALDYFKRALEIQKELEDARGQAITLNKMGQAYSLAGEVVTALDAYRQALSRWVAVGDKQGQALTLYGIASLESEGNNLSVARAQIEEAIGIVESLRTKMASEQLRLSYFATKHDFYGLSIDVMMRLYERDHSQANLIAALDASERGRARSLLDLLAEARTDVRQGVDARLVEEERRLERELNAHTASLLRLRSTKRTADAAAVEERLNTLTEEYDQLKTRIRASSKSYAALKYPQPLGAKEIQQQLLDDDTLLLEYALGEKRSYLWAVTRTSIDGYPLPGRTEIEKAALGLRTLLTAYEPPKPEESPIQYLDRLRKSAAQYRQEAGLLSQTLLGPIASRLGTKRLLIIADGALQFIPFEALTKPDIPNDSVTFSTRPAVVTEPKAPFLAQEHEIIYLPSASTLASIRSSPRSPINKTVAVLADPVFSADDERVMIAGRKPTAGMGNHPQAGEVSRALRDVDTTGDGFRLERLRQSLTEAKEIMALIPKGSGMMAVGFNANRATAMSRELSNYRIVHFATHGIFDDKHPDLSGVVLSMIDEEGQPQDGFLQLHDVYNLSLRVDLVVLSACRTGIGKEVRGEGLIGLTRGFMYAGAARVIASLWKVDDEATAALMERFYRHLIKEGMTATAALRAAKVDIMRDREQWRAPYYWAGFVLQGDWK